MPLAVLCTRKGKLASSCPDGLDNQKHGGDGRDRTDDLMLAKQLLSQLSYVPISVRWPQAPAATSVASGYSAHRRGRPFGLANAVAFGSDHNH